MQRAGVAGFPNAPQSEAVILPPLRQSLVAHLSIGTYEASTNSGLALQCRCLYALQAIPLLFVPAKVKKTKPRPKRTILAAVGQGHHLRYELEIIEDEDDEDDDVDAATIDGSESTTAG